MPLIRFWVSSSDAPLVGITRIAIPGGTAHGTDVRRLGAPIMLILAPVSSMIERASSPSAGSVADSRSSASAGGAAVGLDAHPTRAAASGRSRRCWRRTTGWPRARRSATSPSTPAAGCTSSVSPVGGRPRTAQPATSGMARRAMSRPGNGLVRAMRATRMPQHVQMRTRGRGPGRRRPVGDAAWQPASMSTGPGALSSSCAATGTPRAATDA